MFYILPGVRGAARLSLILTLWVSADASPRTSDALSQSAQVMRKVSRRQGRTLPPPFLQLPVFVDSRLPLVEKEQFSPSRGTGQEALPESVRKILRPVPRPTARPPGGSGNGVSTLCRLNEMHVQVPKSILDSGETQPELKLGTCEPSKTTGDYVYFEYDVGRCGTRRTIINNQVTYSNTLQYKPQRPRGLIRRTAAFTLPVACYYNRYQYSYKIGYAPEVKMRKIFKAMKNQAKFILTPRNAQWERLSPSDEYVLGEPMYFEAEASSLSRDERLYVHSCYATPDKFHTTKPQFPVVSNFGCMIESRDGRSRFIPYKNSVVRFTVDAFLFKGMLGQQLYMHCTMSAGSAVPSPTAKSCNYEANSGRWVELFGSDSVCACCDSNCSSVGSTATKMISSKAWTVEPKGKPSGNMKRKKISTTATTQTASRPKTPRKKEWKVAPQPGAAPGTQVGEVEKEMEWSFRNGRAKWDEGEEGMRQVKGSAVMEEEPVTRRHRIFEEIFVFD